MRLATLRRCVTRAFAADDPVKVLAQDLAHGVPDVIRQLFDLGSTIKILNPAFVANAAFKGNGTATHMIQPFH